MGKRLSPRCGVPGCAGHMELGKHGDGTEHYWCVVCERRILQLQSLHARAAAPASAEITDAQLVKIVQSRMWNLSQTQKGLKRSANLVRTAIRSGAIPSARVGRYAIIPREAAKTWSQHYQRKVSPDARAGAIIAALPREAAKGLTIEAWAKVVGRAPVTLHAWVKRRAKDPRLQVGATVDARRRAVLTFWWKEDAHA